MNRQQFIRQVELHQKTVRRFLMALCCGDGDLADDMAQETFIKAYMSYDGLRDDEKFVMWIHRIAYFTFVSHKRVETVHEDISKAKSLAGYEQSDQSFAYQGLYLALNRLSEKERTVTLLYYMQGYSVAEIAEITSTSVNAVKQQLSRARKNLRELLYGQ